MTDRDEIISKIKKKENKELALMEINREYGHNIREVSKNLRQDKDIIEVHWKKVFRDPSYFINFCSIISIDDFGNSIIEKFKSEELQRHTQSRIDRYEERTEPVQFIKSNNGKLEKEILKPILNQLIIIIGNETNELSNKIIDKYYDKDDKWINIIEIYKEDIDTQNIKFISKNENEILNLLRVITYTTAGDTWLTEDNLGDIKELLWKSDMENKNLEIKTFKDLDNLDTIESDFFNGNTYIMQIASNSEHELYEYTEMADKLQKFFDKKDIHLEYHLHMSCNFEWFEVYILKLY